MAPPSNTPEDRLGYQLRCAYGNISIRDPFEGLNLQTHSHLPKDLDFVQTRGNDLHERVKGIARSYLISQRGKDAADIQLCLGREDIFTSDARDLSEEYGPVLWGWGEPEGVHSRSFVAPQKSDDDLDWSVDSDKETIHFYIRCWIVRLVAEELELPRKKKGKSRRERSFEDGEIAESSDSSDASEIPWCAPESSRYAGFDNRRNNGHTARFGTKTSSRPADLRVNIEKEIENGTPLKGQSIKTPNKRKASDLPGGHSTGKCQKKQKETRPEPVPFLVPQRNTMPLSPTQQSNEIPLHPMFRRQGQRESAQDPDGPYQPSQSGRGDTVETETIYNPDVAVEDESTADAADRFLETNFPQDEEMQHHDFAPPTAGPSGTYRKPAQQRTPTQDSVIPNTQPSPARQLLEAFQVQTTPRNPPRRDSGVTDPRSKTLSPGITRHKATPQYKLWSLLIAYLNSIEEFDPTQPDTTAAEARMDTLLRELWDVEEHTLRRRLGGPTFLRLSRALNAWLSMRDRLTAFQTATQYFGLPGAEWVAHLRSIEDRVEGARARIAYSKLKGWDGDILPYVPESFDADLARVFYLLTGVTGCTRVDDFEAVGEFNRQLFVWVGDEEEVVEGEGVDEEEEETEDEEMELS